jgi:hypothetical protein
MGSSSSSSASLSSLAAAVAIECKGKPFRFYLSFLDVSL